MAHNIGHQTEKQAFISQEMIACGYDPFGPRVNGTMRYGSAANDGAVGKIRRKAFLSDRHHPLTGDDKGLPYEENSNP